MGTHTIGRVTIVTDIYHIPRAWLVARHFGLRPVMIAPSLRGTHLSTQIRQSLREALALPVYTIRLLRRSRRK